MYKASKTFRNSLLAVTVAGVAALMAAAPVQAYVMSSSTVTMYDFVLKDADTGLVLNYEDFSFITYTTTADTGGELTGFGSFAHTDSKAAGEGSIDLPADCVGDGCAALGLAENSFPKLSAPPAGNYAAADQFESGSPLSNTPGFDEEAGAEIAQGSYVGIDDITASGSATSNNNLNSSFIFSMDDDVAVTFEFLVDAWLQVAVSGDEIFPGFATASYSMSFSITDLSTGATVFTWTPDLFGDGTSTLSLNAPLPGDIELTREATAEFFSATTGTLSAATLYQASFRMSSEADARRVAQEVPEPASLALLGLGLAALGVASIRRRRFSSYK